MFYSAKSLTGGGSGALDEKEGSNLVDGDAAVVITSSGVYFYHLNASSGVAESSPSRIVPDNNAGNKVWELVWSATGITTTAVDVDTATETIDSFADTAGRMAVWQYVAYLDNLSDFRSGQIIASWDETLGNVPIYNEISNDGANDISFAVTKPANTVLLRCASLSDDWNVKAFRMLI